MLKLLQNVFTLEGLSHLYPLFWMFAAGLLLDRMPKKQVLVCGKNQQRWERFSAVVLVLPLIFWAGLRGYIGDSYAYQKHFAIAPASFSELLPSLNDETKDPGFLVLMTLAKMLGVSDYRVFSC